MNRINTNKRAGKLAIFLFFTFLSLTTIAQNKDKKITIQNKNISLKEAFAQIETQTGYSIAYEQSKLDIEKKHSLSLKNVTVDKASFNEIFLFCMVIFFSLFCATVVRERKVKNKKMASIPALFFVFIRFIILYLYVDTNCWMVGKLVFTNASAGEIFRTLERHYNTTIDNTATIPASKRYTVKFLKDESLDEILNILKDIIGFDYQQYEKNLKKQNYEKNEKIKKSQEIKQDPTDFWNLFQKK